DQLSFAPAAAPSGPAGDYDDGFSPDLWARGGDVPAPAVTPAPAADALGGGPDGVRGAPAFRLQEQAAGSGGARARPPVRNGYVVPRTAPSRVVTAPARPPAHVARPMTAPPRLVATPRLGGAALVGEPPGTEHPPARPAAHSRLGGASAPA